MNVLILGGTGNISTAVAATLAERGHRVTLCTRGRSPVPERYGHIQADRLNLASLREAAAKWGGGVVIDFIGFNEADCRIVHEAFQGRLSQYIFISSATVYEKPPSGRSPLTEDTPLGNRFSEYARLKEEAETYLTSVNGADFPVTIVRPSHTLGPGWIPSPFCGSGDYTVAARIIAGRPIIVHDDGQSLWTLTASSDFARGLAGLVGASEAIGQAYHITHDQVLTWNEIYHEIGLALGREPEVVHLPTDFICGQFPQTEATLRGDKANDAIFDNLKIKRMVPDFKCEQSFRDIIRESVAWLDEDDARKKINPEIDQMVDALLERAARA